MENGTLTHYIDGGGIDEPAGWEDFTEDLERNFDQRIIATTYPIEVTFTGGANETLRSLYLENFCTTVTYEVDFHCQGSTYRVVRGIISLADIEWNLNRCTAKVKVQDDGYGARIFNNKDIGVFPTSEVTKNGDALTPVTAIALEVFDPTAAVGTYLAQTRKAYDWLACMTHLVGYITDNELTVQSNWYDGLDDDERFALVYGHELRVADGSSLAPQYSFKDLFANAWKKYNLWAYVARTATGAPVLRIELEADTYGTSTAIAMLQQDNLLQSIDTDLLYAKVEIGSAKFIKDEDAQFSLPFLPMQGFTKEEYHLNGTCNTDAALDLVSSFVIDNDVIEDCCINNIDDHDNEIFLIQYDQSTLRATKSDYLIAGGPPWLYNEQLLNITVANRWRLQADGVINIDPLDGSFLAYGSANFNSNFFANPPAGVTQTSAYVQMRYDNDYTAPGFDTTNTWGNGTPQGSPVSQANSRYAAPAFGFYIFDTNTFWQVTQSGGAGGVGFIGDVTHTIEIRMNRFTAANVLLSQSSQSFSHTFVDFVPTGSALFSYGETHQFPVTLNATDYITFEIRYKVLVSTPELSFDSSWTFVTVPECNVTTAFITNGGGILVDADPDEYKATKYTFDRHSNTAEWIALRDDPTQNVVVATDSTELRTTYPLKVSRNIASGATKWENIADRNQPFK